MNLSQDKAQPILENPFFHRGPIRDRSYFFGRTAETRRSLQMLRKNQCVSIVGPRRIGRTSLMFHLCDPEVQKGHGLEAEYLFVYIDCQVLGDLSKLQFYQWLWEKTKRALAERGEAGDWAESISGFSGLNDAMVTIQEKGYRLTLLFDEFESLATNEYMDRALFSSLRSLNQEFTVAYATASQMPVEELTYHDHSALNSPFFHNFQTVPLGLLEPTEAERMVLGLTQMMGQKDYFSGEDLTFLFEVAGYHPFFLQSACYYLFEQKIGRVELATEDYEVARRQYVDYAEKFFRYAWDYLEVDEQKSIRLACEGKVSQLKDEQRQRLERRGILHNNAIFSSAFAEFVRKQVSLELTSQIPVSIPIPKEIAQKPSRPKICQLSITCNKHRWVSVRIAGSLSYEGDSERVLEQGLVDRLDRRATGALHLSDWRFQAKEIGRELFEKLILNRPEIEKGYQRAVGHVQQAALHLALHAPRSFLRLPFEALHSEDEGYLCLKYPMYRVVSGCFFDKEPLSTALISQLDSRGERPRALVIASNTWKTPDSQIPGVEEEVRKVSALLQERGFDVCSLSTDEATEERVRDELEEGNYLLFHYAGHGSYNPDSPEKGTLYFWEGMKGKSIVRKLTVSQLEILIQDTPLRFVYLSSCWGAHTAPPATLLDDDFLGVMDGLVMGGVPAVLGFRWPVSDDGAQLLAQSFYFAWLDEERRLDKALCEARKTVADQLGRDERAWFSPILAMRAPGF